MKQPIFVRPLTAEEYQALEAGLRAADAFTLRRSQILLASARGDTVPAIARALGCNQQTVRNVLRAFGTRGLAVLQRGSNVPKVSPQTAFTGTAVDRLRALLHQSPRTFGKPTSLWTLALVAEVSHDEGLTDQLVSAETVRATLVRLGIGWRRAKQWSTSPDPAYAAKKAGATG